MEITTDLGLIIAIVGALFAVAIFFWRMAYSQQRFWKEFSEVNRKNCDALDKISKTVDDTDIQVKGIEKLKDSAATHDTKLDAMKHSMEMNAERQSQWQNLIADQKNILLRIVQEIQAGNSMTKEMLTIFKTRQ